jgi:serine/threonine protein kinase
MAEIICSRCNAVNKETARFCSECGASLLGSIPLPDETQRSKTSLHTGILLQERYRIVKELGRGGFGAVYRAWDTRLNKAVAVKENLEISPEAQRQFAREALVLASLSHPNLPRVTDHFSLPDQGQYLVMDYVEGNDLESRVREKGVIPLDQALTWILQVAEALEYLHGQEPPVFHRDIKPSNVRITPQGKAMLVDFGLVKVSAPQLRTTMGARAISPGYAPPEQYGHGRTDARTDIYALAATLYRIVTGQDPAESVLRITGDILIPAAKLNVNVPAQISQVIERGMALDPQERFASASAFKAALQKGLDSSRFTPSTGTKLSTEIPHGYQAQPFIGTPVRPIAKPIEKGKVPRTQVVSSEQVSTEQLGSPSAAAGFETQATGDLPYPADDTHYISSRIPPTPQTAQGIQKWGPGKVEGKPARGFSRWMLFAGIGVIVFFLFLVGVVVAIGLSGAATANKTATAEILNTMVAKVEATHSRMTREAQNRQVTSTAQAKQAATAQFRASRTAVAALTQGVRAERTSTAQARSQATEEAVIGRLSLLGIDATPDLVYGPVSGYLQHDPSDGLIEANGPDLEFKNFMAQVTLFTPFSTSKGSWDYGFGFRDIGKNEDYRIILFSDKTWSFEKGLDTITSGEAPGMEIGENESNLVQLVAMDSQGWLFVNGYLVATLNLSALQDAGTVWVGTGFYKSSERVGEKTRYSDFLIWELR